MKNKKISQSLKAYWHHKRVLKDVKAVAGFILCLLLGSQIWFTLKPLPTNSDTFRNNYLPINHDKESLSLIDKILIESYKAGVDGEMMVKICHKESGLNSEATYVNKDKSIDRGICQLNSKWHKEVSNKCAYDENCAIKAAVQIAKRSGFNQWVTYKKLK